MRPDPGDRRERGRRGSLWALGSYLGLWIAITSLGAWTRWPSPWWLLLAAAGAVLFLLRGERRLLEALSAMLVLACVAVGFSGVGHLARLTLEWDEARERREERVGAELSRRLDALIEGGDQAVERLSARAPDLPDDVLVEIRRSRGLDALAFYGSDGELLTWDGDHRGSVPEAVRLGLEPYVYGEHPLFGYLYFTSPVPDGGGTVMAATLLRADLPRGAEAGAIDFASRFRSAMGEGIRISRAEQARGTVWDLRWEGRTLFSVSLGRPAQSEELERVRVRWTRPVALLLLTAAFLLGLSLRRGRSPPILAVSAFLALGALLPLGSLLGIRELHSPGDFLLPGAVGVNLGHLFGVGLAGVVVVGMVRRVPGLGMPLVAVGLVALGGPILMNVLRAGPSLAFVAGTDGEWVAYQGLLVLGLSLLTAVALFVGGPPPRGGDEEPRRRGHLAGAVGLAVVLGLVVALRVEVSPRLLSWVAGLWALPTLWLVLGGLDGGGKLAPSLRIWALAVFLGTTGALPFAWGDRIDARMQVAEEELSRLGARPDPYLEFLLHRQISEVRELDEAGAGPVETLYRGWVGSGLAREGYPVWLTYWSRGTEDLENLRVGVRGERPEVLLDALDRARSLGRDTLVRLDRPGVQYLAVGLLPSGRAVTTLVPPRRSLALDPPLGDLFQPERAERPRVTLVPVDADEELPESFDMEWIRAGEGRRVETLLELPDGTYRAQLELELPGPLLETARAVLLLALNGTLLLALWGVGRLMVRQLRTRPRKLGALVGSFRTRLTLTLFGFFLIPTLVFGTLAYRTLSAASLRTAGTLAQRAVEEGAERFEEEGGTMDLAARGVGGELLLYRHGELVAGAAEGLIDLGLYRGWLPRAIHAGLTGGGGLLASSDESLGGWDYVVAYRRLPEGRILAAPAPVQAGATALRRGEVTHLLIFAILLGAGLSVALSLLAGRTLYRPIQELQTASERVGRGNLGVRLPEDRTDEFGEVFTAFNRMVLRLRRARRALVRTTRRTEAIVEEAATGVIALDPQGRVTLKNPRAESLLGVEILVGDELASGEGPGGDLARWVDLYFRDGLKEAGRELQVEDRRIRVRARRISRSGGLSGAVLSLEDVTDELRTERILAWGEMARQVAHEVKNPLTPIQLGIQHIRRAWEDRRGDFGTILSSNAEAILSEIDRLAAIARSFSRFGAPRAPGEIPLQPVPLFSVVKEILALYGSGQGTISFENRVPGDLPLVLSREPELKEVLVNLLENARAAVSEGGRVVVEAEVVSDGVELRVRDDGAGIGEETLSRIFEPHFSTRSTGTGLGLAIVRRLVESWEGSVSAESREGEGTIIRILLRRGPEPGTREGEGGTIDASKI